VRTPAAPPGPGGLPLSSGVLRTALVKGAGRATYLAAGCKDGQVFLVTADGKPAGHCDCQGRLEDLTVADLNGDGKEKIAAVCSEPSRVHVIAVP